MRALAPDWGHPIGLALVFSQRGDRTRSKRFIPDGRVDPLGSLPGGRYVDIAYHPRADHDPWLVRPIDGAGGSRRLKPPPEGVG